MYLGECFVDAPAELESIKKWKPEVDIFMINGTAWTNAITNRETLRVQYLLICFLFISI